jgi:hypothetical protein
MRPLFALLFRSMREDARSRSTYVLRCLLVCLVLVFMIGISSASRWIGAVGRQFFSSILGIDLFILCVVGLTYFASAITEEKEDDTLGLLRMTELNSLAILLGKSSSRLFGALLLVASQLPFAMLAVTMGGLSVRQVLAGFVLLLSFSFLLANIGLLASTLCRRTSGASLLTGTILAAFSFGPDIFVDRGGTLFPLWKEATTLAWRSHIMWTGFSGPLAGWPCVVHLGLGVLAFLAAWVLFAPCADSTPEAPAASPTLVSGTVLYRSRVPMRAIRWKDFEYISGGPAAVMIKGIILVVGILLIFGNFSRSDFSTIGVGFAITMPSALMLALCLAIDAGRIFKIERREQTLSSLVGMPMPITTIIWEKVRGCLRTSIVPVLCLVLGLGILGCGALSEFGRHPGSDDIFYAFFGFLYAVVAFLMLPVLIAWLSLRMRWGAFPVGCTVWFLGNWIIGMLLAILVEQAAIVLLPAVHGVILGMLVFAIPPLLERLAAEE